jgi:hypothetical protein
MWRLAVPYFVVGLCAGCSSGSGSSASPDTLASFSQKVELSNQVSNWTSDTTDVFGSWTADDYTTQIDGQLGEYTANGLVYAAQQTMDGPNQTQCQIRAMDFGTAAHAQAMLQSQVTSAGNNGYTTEQIPGWPESTAFADGVVPNITVYAIFGQYYFELAFSGTAYGTQGTACSPSECTDVSAFLTAYKTMTE